MLYKFSELSIEAKRKALSIISERLSNPKLKQYSIEQYRFDKYGNLKGGVTDEKNTSKDIR